MSVVLHMKKKVYRRFIAVFKTASSALLINYWYLASTTFQPLYGGNGTSARAQLITWGSAGV